MKQTLITLVEDKPGVLNRVASLFRRRNFNIESLSVGKSETPGVSRMTIVANEPDSHKRGNLYFNLLKLVNVIAVKDVSSLPCISRETILVKMTIGPEQLNDLNDVDELQDIDLSSLSETEVKKEVIALCSKFPIYNHLIKKK